jgi:hypothetical protein
MKFFLIFFLLFLNLDFFLLYADRMIFTGSAEIQNFDVERARNAACTDALLRAALYVKADISGLDKLGSYEAIYEEVIARTHGALKNIIFVKETQVEEYFVAKIQCDIDPSKLDNRGYVKIPDVSKLKVIEILAAGPIEEASTKTAQKLIQVLRSRRKEEKKIKLALLPYGNKKGKRSEEIYGYADILYGRILMSFLRYPDDFEVLPHKELLERAKKFEWTMNSFDSYNAHENVQSLDVDVLVLGRFDLMNFEASKKSDYFSVETRLLFKEVGDVVTVHTEVRAEDKKYIPGTQLFSEKDANLNLNAIRNLYHNNNFDVDFLVDGKPLQKKYVDDPRGEYVGYYFVEAKSNAPFQLKVSNYLYETKPRRSAVAVMIEGQDCFLQEINGKWIRTFPHPDEVAGRFLLEKESVIAGWQQGGKTLEPFRFSDQTESISSERYSIGSEVGSVTVYFYSELLENDQQGGTSLIDLGRGIASRTSDNKMKIYSSPIAIFKFLYRTPEQIQVLKNQGHWPTWYQVGLASYQSHTKRFQKSDYAYKQARTEAMEEAKNNLVDFLKRHKMNFKRLKRNRSTYECIDNKRVFIRIDYEISDLIEVLETYNEPEKLKAFIQTLDKGIHLWGSAPIR